MVLVGYFVGFNRSFGDLSHGVYGKLIWNKTEVLLCSVREIGKVYAILVNFCNCLQIGDFWNFCEELLNFQKFQQSLEFLPIMAIFENLQFLISLKNNAIQVIF